jgi:putative ABC transport system permease protein
MILGNILRVALRSMVAHKMRLVLTMLGIIIGCGAVIAMLALGEGARAAVTAQFEGMGTNLLVLHNHWGRARRQMLSVDEWHLMERQTRYVSMVAPEMDQDLIVRYENKNQESEVFGTTPQYFQVRNIELEAGRIFEELESQTGARVCVIGAEVAAELFEGSDPMHQEIYLGDTSVRVIGLLKAKGGPDSVDEKIIVPMTLAMQRIIGQDHLDAINITVRSHDMVQEAEAALIHALREFRGLTPGEEDNFRFFSQTEVLEEINRRRLASGRRHRHHEHHACDSDRADARDRHSQSARRAAS